MPPSDRPEVNPRSEIKVLLTLTESNIMTQLEASLAGFTEQVNVLAGSLETLTTGITNLVNRGTKGGGSELTYRAPGTENDSSNDEGDGGDLSGVRPGFPGRGGGQRSQFVPYSFWKDEVRGEQHDYAREIMARGFTMPRWGSWTAQDYLSHAGYIGNRIGYRQGMDTQTGARDFMIPRNKELGIQDPMSVEEFVDWNMKAIKKDKYDPMQREMLQSKTFGILDAEGQPIPDDKEGEGLREALREKAMIQASYAGAGGWRGAIAGGVNIRGRNISPSSVGGLAIGAARMAPLLATGFQGVKFANSLVHKSMMPTMSGMEMGIERQGPFDPFNKASGEWWGGQRDELGEFFGNPLLGIGNASEINGIIRQLGYSGGDRERMFDIMTDLRGDKGLNNQQSGVMLDRATRYGTVALEDFRLVMETLPASAQAARMNLENYQKALDAAAQSVSSATGRTYAASTTEVNAISAGLGIKPEDAAKLASDQESAILGANLAGMDLGSYLIDDEARLYGSQMGPQNKFQARFGEPLTTDSYKRHRKAIEFAYFDGKGEAMFGTSKEILQMQARDPKSYQRSARAEAKLGSYIGDLTDLGSDRWASEQYGGLLDDPNTMNLMRKDVRQLVETAIPEGDRKDNSFYEDFIKDLDKGDWADDPAKLLEKAAGVLGEHSKDRASTEGAKTAVTIGFKPGVAANLLKIIDQGDLSDTATEADSSNYSWWDPRDFTSAFPGIR